MRLRKNLIKTALTSILTLGMLFVVSGDFAFAQDIDENYSIDELRQMINEKSDELQSLQEERDKLQQQLNEVNEKQNTLQSEIDSIDYQINQLSVSIESNKLAIEKLDLELDSLRSEIDRTEGLIEDTKSAVKDLFVDMQQFDNENLLSMLLKHSTLSEGLSQLESAVRLNYAFSQNANKLADLKASLSTKLEEVKKNREQRRIQRQSLINRQEIIKDQKEEKSYILDQTRNEEQTYKNEIEELEERQQEISDVVEEIEERLRESFDPDLLPIKRSGVFSFPIEDVLLTQCYGKTEFAQRAYQSSSHTGVDFRADIGTPILAAKSGEVVRVDNNDQNYWRKYQYGKYIMVEHDNNLASLYSHLSKQVVNEGDRVEEGEIIGYSGNTGYITGPHLHFGLYWTPSIQYEEIPPVAGLVPVGVTVDPAPYLPGESNVGNCR